MMMTYMHADNSASYWYNNERSDVRRVSTRDIYFWPDRGLDSSPGYV